MQVNEDQLHLNQMKQTKKLDKLRRVVSILHSRAPYSPVGFVPDLTGPNLSEMSDSELIDEAFLILQELKIEAKTDE
jgi:hypothetical protein